MARHYLGAFSIPLRKTNSDYLNKIISTNIIKGETMSTLLDHSCLISGVTKGELKDGAFFSSVARSSMLPFKLLNKTANFIAAVFSNQESARNYRMRNVAPLPMVRGLAWGNLRETWNNYLRLNVELTNGALDFRCKNLLQKRSSQLKRKNCAACYVN